MIALPCFITLFTNLENSFCDVILDMFFIGGGKKHQTIFKNSGLSRKIGGGGRGTAVLIKAMIILFGYLKKEMLELQDLRKCHQPLNFIL
jgi:hypothetical protein